MASSHSSDQAVRIGRYADEFVCMQSDRHVPNSILRNMYEDDRLCDVSLCGVPAAGLELSSLRPIRSYKAVLAHASKHLYDLFTVDGYIDSHQSEYTVEIVDHDSLRRIVDFIHTDKLMLNAQNAVEEIRKILIGADYLLMKNLSEACENYLAEQIDSSNCISLWCFARKYSCLTLMEETSAFIANEYLEDLPKDEEFLRMPYDSLAKLLMSEAFIDGDGEERYLAALAWLSFDNKDSRAENAYDIMNMVPLASGVLPVETIFQANENEMLREFVPELLRQATINALKLKQGAELRKNAKAVDGLDLTKPTFLIYVKIWNGPIFTFRCTSSTTIVRLKKSIQKVCGIPVEYQQLAYGSVSLASYYSQGFLVENTLARFEISRECSVSLRCVW